MNKRAKYTLRDMVDILEYDLRTWANRNRDEHRWERALREVEEIIDNLLGEDINEELYGILYDQAHQIWQKIQDEFEAEEESMTEEEQPEVTRKMIKQWEKRRLENEERDRELNTPPHVDVHHTDWERLENMYKNSALVKEIRKVASMLREAAPPLQMPPRPQVAPQQAVPQQTLQQGVPQKTMVQQLPQAQSPGVTNLKVKVQDMQPELQKAFREVGNNGYMKQILQGLMNAAQQLMYT